MTDDRRQIRQPLSIVWEFRLHLASGSAAGAGSWGHSLKVQSVRIFAALVIYPPSEGSLLGLVVECEAGTLLEVN